eukprot:TRINITY_DN622_c0_g1_i3.p1 TRINITY_DN622_c0_g1~~TRINITY_DN622_c0_g1_i3.p1  ORF type:complete len:191 (+),score=24.95 TRINITY_DN622_c0_g1_i3:589-1161(+)
MYLVNILKWQLKISNPKKRKISTRQSKQFNSVINNDGGGLKLMAPDIVKYLLWYHRPQLFRVDVITENIWSLKCDSNSHKTSTCDKCIELFRGKTFNCLLNNNKEQYEKCRLGTNFLYPVRNKPCVLLKVEQDVTMNLQEQLELARGTNEKLRIKIQQMKGALRRHKNTTPVYTSKVPLKQGTDECIIDN